MAEDFNYAAFPEILANLRRRHARFELFVQVDSPATLHEKLRTDALDVVLSKRIAGSTEGEFICMQKMAWVGQPDVLRDEDGVVPLAVTLPGTVTRELLLRTLNEAGRLWSIRFEAPTVVGLHAAVLAGLGVTAFGVGVIPPDLTWMRDTTALPPLGAVEFTLGLNPGSTDPVVVAFADVIRCVVPIIVARLN